MASFDESPDIILLRKKRRERQMIRALERRLLEAGIPEGFKIPTPQEFARKLDRGFHGRINGEEVKKFVDFIYGDQLLKKKYVLIDGGSSLSHERKQMGHIILSLAILNDFRGLYVDNEVLMNKFQLSKSFEVDSARSDYIEELKSYDVLFISEIDVNKFNASWHSGQSAGFYDELLTARADKNKLTILSFYKPLKVIKRNNENNAIEGNFISSCGKQLLYLSTEYPKDKSRIRIRVEKESI